MICEETREHLEACEDCRLHIVIEARLRTQPVLDAPKRLLGRVLRALPRRVPVRHEVVRLAAAAAILMGLAGGGLFFGLHRHPAVETVKSTAEGTFRALVGTLSPHLFIPLERRSTP